MTLTEVIADLHTLELGNPELLLATRHVDGKLMEDPEAVHLREISLFEIDDDDAELSLLPRSLATDKVDVAPIFSLACLESLHDAEPDLREFHVVAVDRRGLLDDGSVVSLSLPILGVCSAGPNVAWLILPPKNQWPASWFEAEEGSA